jgi:uroporphyrin-III C-methyltransferase/precorrin-2 dehydrogenase/sirohydrochlorin ferrochelatase
MPVRTLAALVEKAVAEGLDPRTPALAIARATRPDQAVVSAPVADLPNRLAVAGLPGPVLVMIGRALGDRGETSYLKMVRTLANH